MKNARYTGKPLRRLLECYVMWATGELAEPELEKLRRMTPKLQELYSTAGEWHEIVSLQMDFPVGFSAQIRLIWYRNQALAEQSGVKLYPEDFARLFVEQNFPAMV